MLASVLRYPKTILTLFCAASLYLGWQARHFEINASADTLISENNRHFLETAVVNARFSPDDFMLVVYRPDGQALFSDTTLSDLKTLSNDILALESIASVRSVLNVPLLSQAADLSGGDLDQMTQENLKLEPEALSEVFRGHPVYEGLIIDEQQTAIGIQAIFRPDAELAGIDADIAALRQDQLDGELSDTQRAWLNALNLRAEPLRKKLREQRNRDIAEVVELSKAYKDRADIYLGGTQVVGYELIHIIKQDLLVFGIAIAATICLVLLFIFRSLRWVFIPALCCASSVAITTGVFSLLSLKATVISSSFVALQLILTLAIVIHLIVQYREDNREHPRLSQTELVARTLERKFSPCLFAGLTTSIGFGSLMLSGIKPVVDFGWMMVVAVFVSIATSLVLFPAILVLTGRETSSAHRSFLTRFIRFCVHLSKHRRKRLSAVSVLILLLCAAGIAQLTVDNSFINYFRDSTSVHQQLRFIDRKFGGSTPLDIVYRKPESQQHDDLVITAQTAQLLNRLQQGLESHEAVGTTLSVINFTELAKQLNDNKPLTEYELTALYWTVDEAVRRELIGAFYDPGSQEFRISTRIKDTTEGLDRGQLLDSIRAELTAAGLSDDEYKLTNLFVLYHDMLGRLFHSQILTLGLVFAALCLTFAILFQSIRIALIAIVPNLLATAVVLGSMGWLAIPLDFMTITIAAIAMGIAVDNTIHYVHRYKQELAGEHPRDAIDSTHDAVGFAILYTSLVIAAGFSLLGVSDFIPSALFGLFTALGLSVAMFANLTLLPALLSRFVRV